MTIMGLMHLYDHTSWWKPITCQTSSKTKYTNAWAIFVIVIGTFLMVAGVSVL